MKTLLLLSSDSLLNKLFISHTNPFPLQTITSCDFSKGIEMIKAGNCNAIIVNFPFLSEPCPKKIIQQIKEVNPYIPLFVLMDKMELSMAISLTKLGVEYCYSKPFSLEQITDHINNIVSQVQVPVMMAKKQRSGQVQISKRLKAPSKAAEFLNSQISKVADTNFKVIIYGETGSGKESVARALCNGIFKDRPFVAIDCGCLNKELAASELFGHKKGSFSGAFEEKKGAFETANGGTIFLDEIGNLDYPVQILLLRAIEEKKIKKIGSMEEINVNVRIIAASNEKLSEAVRKGVFREDLYHRLNEFEIIIPPLRERKEDIQNFIAFFIKETNEELDKNIQAVSPALLEKLMSYDWPGNIRELKNTIRRGCLMATNIITESCLSAEFMANLNNQVRGKAFEENQNLSSWILREDLKLKSIIAENEEIVKILKEENYNKTKAAKRLNINRKTLYNKLKHFNDLKR